MKKERLPITARRLLNRLVSYGMKAPEGTDSLPVHSTIKILRLGLGMTQAQLAKRAGLVQSHLARIELGQVDLQISTLQKILRALYCEPMLLPKFKITPEEIVAGRVKETAKRRVARVSGSMALEKQLPDESMIHALILAEEERIKNNPSSKIWEE